MIEYQNIQQFIEIEIQENENIPVLSEDWDGVTATEAIRIFNKNRRK